MMDDERISEMSNRMRLVSDDGTSQNAVFHLPPSGSEEWKDSQSVPIAESVLNVRSITISMGPGSLCASAKLVCIGGDGEEFEVVGRITRLDSDVEMVDGATSKSHGSIGGYIIEMIQEPTD